ncbi:hypothetical protein BJ508DRAFT_307644 [Ascobolus immersus RN42]|uniref:Uncharacterized protein n=1 Tax=Ascobolus immersus RN42 TaxID=1160509 RepID=A0A3N4I2D7_ASCIM|nr:hypothetical protein BJ508DRAFT_307644 [Ascobolus immersus RN42]
MADMDSEEEMGNPSRLDSSTSRPSNQAPDNRSHSSDQVGRSRTIAIRESPAANDMSVQTRAVSDAQSSYSSQHNRPIRSGRRDTTYDHTHFDEDNEDVDPTFVREPKGRGNGGMRDQSHYEAPYPDQNQQVRRQYGDGQAGPSRQHGQARPSQNQMYEGPVSTYHHSPVEPSPLRYHSRNVQQPGQPSFAGAYSSPAPGSANQRPRGSQPQYRQSTQVQTPVRQQGPSRQPERFGQSSHQGQPSTPVQPTHQPMQATHQPMQATHHSQLDDGDGQAQDLIHASLSADAVTIVFPNAGVAHLVREYMHSEIRQMTAAFIRRIPCNIHPDWNPPPVSANELVVWSQTRAQFNWRLGVHKSHPDNRALIQWIRKQTMEQCLLQCGRQLNYAPWTQIPWEVKNRIIRRIHRLWNPITGWSMDLISDLCKMINEDMRSNGRKIARRRVLQQAFDVEYAMSFDESSFEGEQQQQQQTLRHSSSRRLRDSNDVDGFLGPVQKKSRSNSEQGGRRASTAHMGPPQHQVIFPDDSIRALIQCDTSALLFAQFELNGLDGLREGTSYISYEVFDDTNPDANATYCIHSESTSDDIQAFFRRIQFFRDNTMGREPATIMHIQSAYADDEHQPLPTDDHRSEDDADPSNHTFDAPFEHTEEDPEGEDENANYSQNSQDSEATIVGDATSVRDDEVDSSDSEEEVPAHDAGHQKQRQPSPPQKAAPQKAAP